MSHVETMEIVLQGYMPEVERAPWSPDSWAPVSQRLLSSGVLVCPKGFAKRRAVLLPCLFTCFPGCIPRTAGSETAVLSRE